MTALGLRDDNPLNLIWRPQDKWLGLASPPNNGRFCSFTSPQYAFRAYTIQLKHYLAAGQNTVPKIIKLWSETDQVAYTTDVLMWGRFKAMQVLTVEDFPALFKAMCRQEDGSDPFDDSVIQEGIDMANGNDSAGAPAKAPAGMGRVMNSTTAKNVSGGSAAAFIAMELAKFHLYDMSSGETIALGILLTIILHRVFPQGLSVD